MTVDRQHMTRRVYEITTDLHARIKKFADDLSLSEVEAVRRLLTEALAARESGHDLEARLKTWLAQPERQLRDVLDEAILHPGIVGVDIGETQISFRHQDGHHFQLSQPAERP